MSAHLIKKVSSQDDIPSNRRSMTESRSISFCSAMMDGDVMMWSSWLFVSDAAGTR